MSLAEPLDMTVELWYIQYKSTWLPVAILILGGVIMSKKFYLFDLDGTLTDPKVGITKSVQYSLREFGIDVENADDLVHFIGPPLRESYKRYYSFNDSQAEKAVAEYRKYFSQSGIFENAIYTGIESLLKQQYEKGKTLIIATSKPTVYAIEILKHFKIYDYFSFIAGSELNGERSKKAEVIQYAIENAGISSADDAVMIGDKEHDIIGAKAHAMDSIGVLYGYGSLDELLSAKATHIAETVDDLARLVSKV